MSTCLHWMRVHHVPRPRGHLSHLSHPQHRKARARPAQHVWWPFSHQRGFSGIADTARSPQPYYRCSARRDPTSRYLYLTGAP
eukprot:3943598-Prymnesium_polylepis.1